jgi:RNA polymerase-binding transcription factor DksA
MGALTRQQLTHLDRILVERYRTLVSEVRAMLEQSGNETYVDIAGRVTDTGDESVADMLADMGAAQIHRHVQELRDVEAAQARLRAGTFGICIDCDGEIAPERLTAHPTAKRCIQCQSKRERSYAHEGRPTL